MTNGLNVLFMPAIDEDLSNYIHYVAPDQQHSSTNWKASTGDEVSKGQTIFELEYEDVANMDKGGWPGFILREIGIMPKHASGTFALSCPVSGTFHSESGFYGTANRIRDFDKADLDNKNVSLRGLSYSFHIFTNSNPTIFPYSFYKPWFEFMEKNKAWMENSVRHWSGDEGVQNWQKLIGEQKRRLQAIPCKVISYGRFMELQRELWKDNPNKPAWLD